jgi:tyrosyl-tRNA synthetase
VAARKPSPQELDRILNRGVADIIPRQEFIERLQQAKPLRLKMGFDPSRPDLHIGHVVGLRKLRQLQDLGHELILIVGDWTAQIGDPSGESEMRTMLSAGDVRKNAETYMRQFFKVMDSGRTRAVYQSEWFGKFTLTDVIRLTSHFTVNQFLHRDDFGQRYAAQRPIAVTEMLYPLLQAYDSVAIEADVEFGGTDQLFNLLVGRELQERVGQRPQVVFTMPILPGTDGVRKMSKSLDNYIAIEDTPDDIFGKVMSLPDDVVPLYYELLTDRSDDEVAEVRAAFEEGREGRGSALMDAKKALGAELVAHFYGTEDAASAQAEFERVFQSRQVPTDVPEFAVTDATPGVTAIGCERASVELSRLLVAAGLAVSRSEAARLIDQGAVQIDGERAESDGASIAFGAILRAGRRRFARMVKG